MPIWTSELDSRVFRRVIVDEHFETLLRRFVDSILSAELDLGLDMARGAAQDFMSTLRSERTRRSKAKLDLGPSRVLLPDSTIVNHDDHLDPDLDTPMVLLKEVPESDLWQLNNPDELREMLDHISATDNTTNTGNGTKRRRSFLTEDMRPRKRLAAITRRFQIHKCIPSTCFKTAAQVKHQRCRMRAIGKPLHSQTYINASGQLHIARNHDSLVEFSPGILAFLGTNHKCEPLVSFSKEQLRLRKTHAPDHDLDDCNLDNMERDDDPSITDETLVNEQLRHVNQTHGYTDDGPEIDAAFCTRYYSVHEKRQGTFFRP